MLLTRQADFPCFVKHFTGSLPWQLGREQYFEAVVMLRYRSFGRCESTRLCVAIAYKP